MSVFLKCLALPLQLHAVVLAVLAVLASQSTNCPSPRTRPFMAPIGASYLKLTFGKPHGQDGFYKPCNRGEAEHINARASNKVSRSRRPHILISRPYLRRWFKAILHLTTTLSIAALGRSPPSGLSLVRTSLYVLPSSLCVFAPCTVLGSEGNLLILNYINHKLAFGPYLRPQSLTRYSNFGACLREVFSEERSSIRWLLWPVWS